MIEPKMYNPAEIESRWQARWEKDGLYHANIDPSRPKHYALTMLPYPSGDLHIGHWYAMTPSDARARFMRMCGYNVLFPMGFDAFGLPAENAAIKLGIHPKERTYANIAHMREQMKSMGAMFDWRREITSADPEYYRWTQWFFIRLFQQGLAYRKMSPVDWCPNCNTTLAREQVWGDDRHCERCGTPVIKKELDQWFFRTTQYAEELLNFEGMEWPERVRVLQENWINRSEGASVIFHTEQEDPIEIFTTRPDTLWGATFMVLLARASAGGEPDHARTSSGSGSLPGPGGAPVGYRPRGRRQGKDGCVHRQLRGQPGQQPAHPDLDCRLRADDLRHRGDHGSACPRRARLCLCQEI